MFIKEINGDDYKAIYREIGITPDQYRQLQDLCRKWVNDRLYANHQVKIYACQCKSVWCDKCAASSPTNLRINAILAKMDWRKVRHIILTLSRETPAKTGFFRVRARRSIAKLMKKLHCEKWLWVLEFHADGYPHWHVLTETPNGRMLGKRRIQRLWKYGHVWESYIANAKHWTAITGYHKNKGYLAGENKKHQLVLPEFLLGETAVRKYGKPIQKKQPQKTEKNVPRETPATPKTPNKSYKERFKLCDTQTTICVNQNRWTKIQGSLSETRELFTNELEELDYMTFNVQTPEKFDHFLEFTNGFAINNDK